MLPDDGTLIAERDWILYSPPRGRATSWSLAESGWRSRSMCCPWVRRPTASTARRGAWQRPRRCRVRSTGCGLRINASGCTGGRAVCAEQ